VPPASGVAVRQIVAARREHADPKAGQRRNAGLLHHKSAGKATCILTMTDIFENEVEIRQWAESINLQLARWEIMGRVKEILALLADPEIDLRAWRAIEHQRLVSDPAYRLRPEQLARVQRLLEIGRGTLFGKELEQRGIDADHQLVHLVHQYSRGIAQGESK